ncbi:MAG: NTP transferase domain-containing protein, partial [Candidatus Omnitrophota bacterium]
MVKNTATVILAAGKSTRMNSSFSKVLHKIYGKTMLEYITDSIRAIGINKICIVTNRNNDLSKAVDKTGGIDLVFQDKLMGTGHALRQTSKVFENFNGDLLVLYGDTPLLKSDVLKNLVEKHKSSKAACTLLTTSVSDPKGYGRIIRDKKNDVVDIVEENVASVREKMIKEINVGVYCFNAKEVFKVLQGLKAKGSKSEYYLTDAVGMLAREKHAIESLHIEDIDQTLGVNTRLHLARAQAIVKERILTQHMMEGVGIIDPETTHIYHDVTIGQDTIIYPFTVIERDVVIGKRCRIGPFARIRPGCVLKDEVEIGNYVEMVRTKVGSGSA